MTRQELAEAYTKRSVAVSSMTSSFTMSLALSSPWA